MFGPKSLKIALLGIGIVVVILGTIVEIKTGVFFSASPEYVVSMTEGAFVPENLEIPVGGIVRFVNSDGKPRWPASNLHPTHGIYPEFDPQRVVTPGESWGFKFKKPGIWRYHDHLHPAIRGVITVK